MCGDPSPEAFGVSENARRPLAGDFRSVGKCAATPRRGFSGCRKVSARGRRTFCTFFKVCSVTPDQILHIISSSLMISTLGKSIFCKMS